MTFAIPAPNKEANELIKKVIFLVLLFWLITIGLAIRQISSWCDQKNRKGLQGENIC